MSRIFYDHLIVMEDLEMHVSKLEITGEEKQKMHTFIEETIHYRVMTRILSELPKKHHQRFLASFTRFPHHPQNLAFLKQHIVDIEEKIVEEIKALEKTLLKI